jgi:hypothetical protein
MKLVNDKTGRMLRSKMCEMVEVLLGYAFTFRPRPKRI